MNTKTLTPPLMLVHTHIHEALLCAGKILHYKEQILLKTAPSEIFTRYSSLFPNISQTVLFV